MQVKTRKSRSRNERTCAAICHENLHSDYTPIPVAQNIYDTQFQVAQDIPAGMIFVALKCTINIT